MYLCTYFAILEWRALPHAIYGGFYLLVAECFDVVQNA